MVDIGEMLKEIMRLHPDFSLKIGRVNGTLTVEVKVANHKPAVAMGTNLVLTLNQAHGEALTNVAERFLSESRLGEAVFDNAVASMEDGCSGRCCGCRGCNDYDNFDNDDDEF